MELENEEKLFVGFTDLQNLLHRLTATFTLVNSDVSEECIPTFIVCTCMCLNVCNFAFFFFQVSFTHLNFYIFTYKTRGTLVKMTTRLSDSY